ncbi:MAG: Ig-like domain-containing protein, partial [bacterium]
VSDLLVGWTTSDATLAIVTPTGSATATVTGQGRRGTVAISAVTPTGIAGTTHVSFIPAPARIVVVGGGAQTGVAGSTLPQPLIVEVQATDNLPVPGAPVTFTAVTPGGAVQTASATTDASGRASTTVTLGRTGGPYIFQAVSGALPPAAATETATPAPPAALAIESGDQQTDSVGRALAAPLAVKVTDQFGGAVSGASVAWTVASGTGTLGGATTTTDAQGVARNTYTLGGVIGTETVRATVTGVTGAAGTALFTATAISRAASTIALVSGGAQSGIVGTALTTPLVLRVTDALSNPVSNVAVTLSASAGGVTFAPATSNTDANGRISTLVTLGPVAGVVTITAAAGAISTSTTFTIGAGPATKFGFVQPAPASITVGGPTTVVSVRLQDAFGNAVAQAGIAVIATAVTTPAGGGGTFSASTDGEGVATFTFPSYTNVVGSLIVTFGATGITPLSTPTVVVVAGGAAQLLVATQPAATAIAGALFAPQPVIQLADAGGNPLATAGVPVVAAIQSGGGTLGGTTTVQTDAAGKAAFTSLFISGTIGQRILTFTSGTLTPAVSQPIALAVGSASTLALQAGGGQTAVVGASVPVVPSVRVSDVAGNGVAGVSVTFTPRNGSMVGATTTPVTVATNLQGVATIASWSLGPLAAPNADTLDITATGLTGSPIRLTAHAIAGAATRLAFQTLPPTSIVSGVIFSPAVQVRITDQNGNAVALANQVVRAFVSSGPGLLGGVSSATTDASGIATFTTLSIASVPGASVLSFTDSTLASITSAPITIIAGAPTQLLVRTAPQTGAVLSTLAQPVVIEVQDASNTPLSGITLALQPAGNNATLNGTPSATTLTTNASGQASFTWKLGRSARQDSVHVTVPLTSLQVDATATAIAGPPSQLIALTPQPLALTGGIPTGGSSWAPYVVIVSDSGGVDTVATTAPVSLAINRALNSDASLSGTTTVNAVNGVATFTLLSINLASVTYRLDVSAPSLTGVPTLTTAPPFTIGIGTLASIGFIQEPLVGTSGIPLTPAITVAAFDAGGNTVSVNAPSYVRLAIGSGTQGALLTGDSAVFVNGVATFPGATLDQGGTYTLVASTTAAGNPKPVTSQSFVVSTLLGGGALALKSGGFNVLPVGTTAQVTPVFVAKTVAGAPYPGQTVYVNTSGRCRLNTVEGAQTTYQFVTDLNGEAAVPLILPTDPDGTGCIIRGVAEFTSQQDSALVALYPAATTHVWTGRTSVDWNTASNWYTPAAPATPTVPNGATTQVFIPNYTSANSPQMSTRPVVGRIVLDTSAVVNLSGVGLDVGSGGVSGFGVFLNGTVHLAATGYLNGIFDQLDVGQSGSCGFAAPMTGSLRTISANVMNVYCRTRIDSTGATVATLNTIQNGGEGRLSITGPNASLQVSGNVAIAGDSLSVAGNMYVSGSAALGGKGINVTGTVQVQGNATFNADAATYGNASVYVGGAVAVGGGNAGVQQFFGGQLTVLGSFTELPGIVAGTFRTGSDHLTLFAGTTPQTISMSDTLNNHFSGLQLQNPAGVQLLSSVSVINGTTQPRVILTLGQLYIPPGTIMNVGGFVSLGTGTTLNVDGQMLIAGGTCSGRANGATTTGAGSVNGVAMTAACP